MNTNGVIHVIDKVLMPEMDDEPAEPLVQIRGDGANF